MPCVFFATNLLQMSFLLMNERTIGEEAKKLGVHLDSWILLAKLHFSMGNYSDSLKYYEKAQIESLEEKHLPTRSLKIMAEAFAIKGHCYEKLPLHTTSKHKLLDREAKVLKCYEVAGDLTLLYLQVTSLVEINTVMFVFRRRTGIVREVTLSPL